MTRFLNGAAQATLAACLFLIGSHAARAACSEADRFALNDDEATDRKTGLVWKRCSFGQEWLDRDGCRGDIAAVTYPDAVAMAQRAGDGWRLPTADELLTLVARDCREPAIDRDTFPDTPLDPGGDPTIYWTATAAGMGDMMVTVDFRDGFYDMHSRGLNYFVRLVRSPRK